MAEESIKLTIESVLKLEKELESLKGPKRREMAERIKVARSFGDLSENSEYDDAKNEQAQMEKRIAELEKILRNVEVVNEEDISIDSVGLGTKVKLLDIEFEEEIVYQIVSSNEANPALGLISNVSPLGEAMAGKRVGDIFSVKAPSGEFKYKVLEIAK